MPGIIEELLGVCCPANVLTSDIPGAIAKSMLVTKNNNKRGEQDDRSTRHTTDDTRHITNRKNKRNSDRSTDDHEQTQTFGTCAVTSLHCLSENCSDVNLDIHFKYILSANLVLTVALRPKLLPFQGLERGNHSLVHMSSGSEPKYSYCMPDASSFHDIAFT
jgi:hypothetical protein